MLSVICILVIGEIWAAKCDTLYLYNGDKITGEVKSLDYGKLRYKTDDMGTLYIKWDKIKSIYTCQFLEVVTKDGTIHYAHVRPSREAGMVRLIIPMMVQEVDLFQIIRMTPINNSFIGRIDGAVDVGLSYTKASDVAQLNTSADATYKGRKFETGFRASLIYTQQSSKPDARKQDINLFYTHQLLRNWFVNANLTQESNSELGLRWRVLGGGEFGHEIVRDIFSSLKVSTGLYYNAEEGEDITTNSLEGAIVLSYRHYRYDSPKLDLFTSGKLYPSLTQSGRYRAQYDLQVRLEVVKDLFVGLNIYYTFDNKPRAEEASNSDWGVVTSLGYSF